MTFKTLIVALVGATLLAGCNYRPVPDPALSAKDTEWMAMIPPFEVGLEQQRYEIQDPTGEAPGTIIVDTKQNFLYFVLPGKRAIRYGVATGAEAYGWTGTAQIKRKAEWPRWMPPADMVARWPHLKPTAAAGGLNGGPDNPLGARALYLYEGGRDTLYRIHGTNEPEKIGTNVSSGCIRMRNIDIVDLYNRTPVGAKVIVR
ncbi:MULTISPECIES: L,D-transpeptidase [unclassified Beijerinckia]|uniref:L,D-transpeptidase n=1 Tax=unclassified Beijerinckia TaxID=2638183 RepID=UPI0008976722|nr:MULTISPECIES: L,D-transpeptidase [unclassified Beijerinckia]MDH7797404.1 lipoprotein-anchoring transpeptidase ErfK/SrfK [Beijerinckia sp. GAS462]SEC84147.1 L,D-transpeptidase catalytic domain [Beijerinckia sp. 28-YEA-48]